MKRRLFSFAINAAVVLSLLLCVGNHAMASDAPPAPSTRPAAIETARLRSARQALTIARDDCLTRLRQTDEYAQLREKLESSSANRARARESGTVQQQIDAEEAHLKRLMDMRDLMVSAMNADPAVARAKAELAAAAAESAKQPGPETGEAPSDDSK